MKVAIVHDWLTGLRGGERCLEAFLRLYPAADIFTLLHVPGSTTLGIDERVHTTSFLQSLPAVSRYYRAMLPLFPAAVSGFSFRGYDLVVSLSHAAAKNIRVPDDVPHVSYCFTPMRYIWDQADVYFGSATPAMWPLIRYLRGWDIRGNRGVDHFVAISRFVASRIRCFYKVRPSVIFPPVDYGWVKQTRPGVAGDAFLFAGALVPYKRADLVIAACNRLGEKLWVVGTGPEERRLRAMAGKTIEFVGRVSDAELAEYYRHSRALVFPGKEDFGLIPVECMASGRPVIGLGHGGVAETVHGLRSWRRNALEPTDATGVFMRGPEPTVDGVVEALRFFRDHEGLFGAEACIRRAAAFSPEVFTRAWNAQLVSLGLQGAVVDSVENTVGNGVPAPVAGNLKIVDNRGNVVNLDTIGSPEPPGVGTAVEARCDGGEKRVVC
jgi:glycosyltransferase involved in cell wall biosynthesis